MCVAAAIVGGASLVGGAINAKGAKDAGKAAAAASQAGTDASIAESRRQYDQTRQDFAPYRDLGYSGINSLSRLYGFAQPAYGQPPGTQQPQQTAQQTYDGGPGYGGAVGRLANQMFQSPQFANGDAASLGYSAPANPGGAPDMSVFFNSPDYQFRRNEGMRDIGNSFAARGGAFSGNALKALNEYNSNLASGEYGNFVNRLAGFVNAGQGGTAQTAAAGANASGNIVNALQNNAQTVGNARASGIQGAYGSIGDAIGTAGGLAGAFYANQPYRGVNNLYRGQTYYAGGS